MRGQERPVPFPYTVIRSRRKTIAIQVRQDGSVVLRIPAACPVGTAEQFLREKQDWVLEKRRQAEEYRKNRGAPGVLPEREQAEKREEAKRYFALQAERYARRIGVSYGRITIRDQKTRWGSCTPSSGRIRLNLQLAAYPTLCLDYVIVHELVHLKIPGHPKKFWETVGYYFPEYKKARDLLRQGIPYSSPGN